MYPVWPNWNLRLDRGTQYTFSGSILVHGLILAHLISMSPRYSDYLATLQKEEDTTALTSNGPLHFSSSCPPSSFFFASCDGLIWRVRPSSTAITVGQPISIRAIASGIQRAAQGFPTFSYVLLCVGSLLSRLMLVVDKLRTAVSYELTSILLRGWEPLCYEEDIHISD